LFGYEQGRLVGLRLESLLPERLRKRHTGFVGQFFAEPIARPMGKGRELLAIGGDGEEFPVEIAIGPIQGGDLAVAVIRDITEIVRTRDELTNTLKEVQQLKDRLQRESGYLQAEIKSDHNFDEIIGNSAAIKSTLHKVEQVATTDATVLLLGETGTGKELLARAVHSRSKRKGRPLIKVDCTSLPSGLIESELFGHLKGAFTGAHESRPGRFELADGGTIFLDEIGELPIELQAKLLQVIQEGEFQRLGAKRVQHIDVRIIAATNRDLQWEMQAGRFRSDLCYRLSTFLIEIPALRDRREDIPPLTAYFVSRRSKALGKNIASIPTATMDAVMAYDWPGNVRELQNVCDRAIILSPGSELVLAEGLLPAEAPRSDARGSTSKDLKSIERQHILEVLGECGWKIKGEGNAASRLGLKPSTLRARMKRLGIERPAGYGAREGRDFAPCPLRGQIIAPVSSSFHRSIDSWKSHFLNGLTKPNRARVRLARAVL
ncbi:MAG: sigma 54-interacting transcriptional regulator, partial [Thermoanaerobaculia bacterium]